MGFLDDIAKFFSPLMYNPFDGLQRRNQGVTNPYDVLKNQQGPVQYFGPGIRPSMTPASGVPNVPQSYASYPVVSPGTGDLSVLAQNKPHDTNRFAPFKSYDEYAKWLATSGFQPQVQQNQQMSLPDNLLQQLISGLNQGAPKIKSEKDLRKYAAEQAALIYNPQIDAYKELISGSRADAKSNAADLKALYKELASSYADDIAWSKKETASAKADENKALQALGLRIDDQYADQYADQAEEFAKLGITDALPASTDQQTKDLEFINQLNASGSAADQRYLSDIGRAEQAYYNQNAGVGRQRGVESIEDLYANMNNYVQQQNSAISQLVGQRSATTASTLSDLLNSQNSAASQYQNEQWNRMYQLYNILNQNQYRDQQSQMDLYKMLGNGGGAGNSATKGILGAYNTIQGLLGNGSQNTISAFQNFMQSVTQRENQFETQTGYQKMTPQQAAFEARAYAQQFGLSAPEADALVNAVYAYYGAYQ